MAVLGLRFCARAFSSCGKRGPLFIAVRGPLIAALLWSTGYRRAGSVIVAHGPSCSPACGIFPDQGTNPCPLHWQADSQPLRHQGSPTFTYLIYVFLNKWDDRQPLIPEECNILVNFTRAQVPERVAGHLPGQELPGWQGFYRLSLGGFILFYFIFNNWKALIIFN